MSSRASQFFSFGQCLVQSRDVLRVFSQADQLNQAGQPNTTMMKWVLHEGKRYDFHLDWTVNSMDVVRAPALKVFASASDGRVAVADTSGQQLEHVDLGPNGPSVYGLIRQIKWIGHHLYAAGMRRQVYRRKGPNDWEHVDSSIVQPPDLDSIVGFNSIAGVGEKDVICVGFEGEIYSWNGRRWRTEESPTNVVLNRVKFSPMGVPYACGQLGVIVRRVEGRWENVQQDATTEQIWDIEWFGEHLYFATEANLYRMSDGGDIEDLELTDDRECSFGYLDANDGVLMTSGTKDVFWTSDAKKWNELS